MFHARKDSTAYYTGGRTFRRCRIADFGHDLKQAQVPDWHIKNLPKAKDFYQFEGFVLTAKTGSDQREDLISKAELPVNHIEFPKDACDPAIRTAFVAGLSRCTAPIDSKVRATFM